MNRKEFYLEKAHEFRDIALGISARQPIVAQELFALAAKIEADAQRESGDQLIAE